MKKTELNKLRNDLKAMSAEELSAKKLELLKEQFNLRMQASTGQLNQTHQLKDVRRNLARIETLLTQKAGE